MKDNANFVHLLKIISILISTSLISANAFAKEIPLLDQPKADAKAVGKVDTAVGIIPIFTPKDSEWIKVADPRNGDVGWIKSKDMSNGTTNSFTFTQRVIENPKGGQNTYQIFQYGTPKNLSAEQVKEWVQRMEAQQQNIQRSMQKNIQDMINDMNDFYKQQFKLMDGSNMAFPIVMPIVIVPAEKASTPAASTATGKK